MKALGGQYPSIMGNINNQFINPASLSHIEDQQIAFNYSNYLLDLQLGAVNYALPLNNWGNLGLGAIYFDYGKISEVNADAFFTGRNFHSADFALISSYSNRLNYQISYGFNLKYIHSQIDHFTARAVAADFGLLYDSYLLDHLILGIAVRNVGKNFDPYNKEREELPTQLGVGVSKRVGYTPLMVHAALKMYFHNGKFYIDNYQNFSVGMEFSLGEQLELNIGYNHDLNQTLPEEKLSAFQGLSAGFGVNLGDNILNYSYANYGQLGITHHFGITFNLRSPRVEKDIAEEFDISRLDYRMQPRDVKYKFLKDKIIFYWRGMKKASYNVYGRLQFQTDWIILNKTRLAKNFIIFQRPKTKGIYLFKIASIINNQISMFSETVRIEIR